MKPQTIDGYRPESTDHVRSACLHLATILGDYLDDVIIVGGLVPSLLVDQEMLPDGVDGHAGTADLDVGLSLTVLDEGRYTAIAERLRGSGFEPAPDDDGRQKFRWRWTGLIRVTVDFLIPPTTPARQPGKHHELEPGFVALVVPGLGLAFRDAQCKTLTAVTLDGAVATRTMKICGPAAFVAMKALAFGKRGERKDAYDLYYLLRSYGGGVEEIARSFQPLLDAPDAQEALDILRNDFASATKLGPTRVGAFLKEQTLARREDVATYVRELLRLVGR